MGRHTRPPFLKKPEELERAYGSDWYQHYYQYISSLAYQLFEWENLPDSVDPRYLEMTLHMFGYIGFYKDKELGYIVSQGAVGGQVNHYLQPTTFKANSPQYQEEFDVYNYADMKDPKKKQGVIIWNNDYHYPTTPSLRLFAEDLASIKEIIQINQNAQKTPILLLANDKTRTSIENIYKKYSGNSPVIITHESVDPDALQVMKTDAPYVVDKLNTQRNAVWNEIMTYLGIKNANLEKRERMITDEVESNDEQIESSLNIYLKARKEACDRINDLYGLQLDVKMRDDVVEAFQNQALNGREEHGDLHVETERLY